MRREALLLSGFFEEDGGAANLLDLAVCGNQNRRINKTVNGDVFKGV